MYCENCGSKIDHSARFCDYCGHEVTGPLPSAGRVAPVQSGDVSDLTEGSRRAQTWIWTACGGSIVTVLFAAGLIVLNGEATSRDIAPSESALAVRSVRGDDFPIEVIDTNPPTPENGDPETSCRSFEASKPPIPTSPLPLANPDLHSAVWRGKTEQVRALVAGGADVNTRDSDNDPLLHEAVWRGHTEVVRILVDAGADVNAKDSNNDPLLHEAIFRGHTEIVRILINAGVDVNASNSRGDSPLDYARFWTDDDSEILQLLIAAGSTQTDLARSTASKSATPSKITL